LPFAVISRPADRLLGRFALVVSTTSSLTGWTTSVTLLRSKR
jgi:hypothetical protein